MYSISALLTSPYVPAVLWFGTLIIFLAVEAATVGLVSLWFAGGALVALIVSLCGGQIWLQLVLFFVTSVILLACLRPFAQKFVHPISTRTNADRVLGQQALVVETIDNLSGKGAVKISGVEWTARSSTDTVIEAGTLVTILRIEGAKVTVQPSLQKVHEQE